MLNVIIFGVWSGFPYFLGLLAMCFFLRIVGAVFAAKRGPFPQSYLYERWLGEVLWGGFGGFGWVVFVFFPFEPCVYRPTVKCVCVLTSLCFFSGPARHYGCCGSFFRGVFGASFLVSAMKSFFCLFFTEARVNDRQFPPPFLHPPPLPPPPSLTPSPLSASSHVPLYQYPSHHPTSTPLSRPPPPLPPAPPPSFSENRPFRVDGAPGGRSWKSFRGALFRK